jgi:homogentisate 1,2-dioxygenase
VNAILFYRELETHDEVGDFLIVKKGRHDRSGLRYTSFDVVGWDGYNYPYGFSIITLNPLQDGYINRHQYIKHLKLRHL